jgi:glucose/mannose-6-phosphate isomerase
MPHATLSEADVRAIDRSDMAGRIAGLAAQVRHQRAALQEDPWPRLSAPRLLAVGGMGGSAIAADLVLALAAPRLPFPALVCRDDRWPAAVGPGTVALLSSYSGNTEETLRLYDEAGARGATRLVLATGGELAARAEADGSPRRAVPGGLPPRAALGYSVASLSLLLEALGDPGEGDAAWDEAVAALEDTARRCAPDRPEADNPAKALARALVGRALSLVGTAGPGAACARRWKGQVHENAKSLAFDAVLPEMNHNEIVGWQALADLHPRFAVVFLSGLAGSAATAAREDVTRRLLDEAGVATHVVRASGDAPLARVLSLVALGDWTSLYLAVLAGVDPTPIERIDRLKAALASAGGRGPGDAPRPGRGDAETSSR